MSSIKLSCQEAFDFADDGELVSSVPIKYGTLDSYVLEEDWIYRKMDIVVTDDGWQEDGFETYEVKPVEKTIIEWVKVKW